MISYGIMQGRLTPTKGRGIQFFPFDNWEEEFILGSSIGINEIEWIFDYEGYEANPLWSDEGIERLNLIINQSEVVVRSVCFDYFMRRPFHKQSVKDRKSMRNENLEFVHRIIYGMTRVGARLLEIPLIDDSSVNTSEERELMIDFLREILEYADKEDVFVGCETDMPIGVFREFLDDIHHKRIKANYDSGNSSGFGYNHTEEINSLGEYIANVHIKDRVYQGTTVELGTGSADFNQVFSSLESIGYGGGIILQAARNEDGKEADTIASQLSFIKGYCEKYKLR